MTLKSMIRKLTGGKPAKKAPKKAVAKVKKQAPKKTVSKKAVKKAAIPKRSTHTKSKGASRGIRRIPVRENNVFSASRFRKTVKTAKKSVKQQRKAAKRPAKETKKPAIKAAKLHKDQEFAQALLHPEMAEKKQVKPYPVLENGASERVSALLPILRDLVKRGAISDWLIGMHHERSSSMYVERNFNVEDETSAVREDVMLTVYERFPDGMGEAQLPITSSDAAEIKAAILAAKETCAYTKKKAFTLPQPVEGISLPQGHDERMLKAAFSGAGFQLPRDLYHQVKAVMAPMTDVKLNSFEILTSASTIRVLNSNGIDISHHKTQIYVEFILTCRIANEEREFIMSKVAVSPEQLDIQGLLLQQAQIARDATAAKPNPGYNGNVVFSGPSVVEFFAPHHDLNPLILHAMAKLHYMDLSVFKRGQPLGTFTGEPITVMSNPSLPLGLQTAPVDMEGNPLKPVDIIRNGVFVNHIATSRYAQYLGVPVTGMVSNIQVSPGATREEHLRGNDYFEIVSFSWFNPNPFSGDFAAEIRLGYHWRNGRRTPLRGGTFTGNVFRNILNARFSKEVMQSGEYYGPRVILFKDGVINRTE